MSELLKCINLTKKYGSFTALSDFNLDLERGKIIGLLGPNGSGKTTLIKTINGLLKPTSGSVLINGEAPGPNTMKVVSYLPERTYLMEWMKISEAIQFFCDFYDDFNKERALDMLKRLNLNPELKLKTLSKGNKEKVQLILVMSREAQLYCLDEPIGGVDPATRDYILDTIITNYCENSTILISTHLISDVEKILDEVVFIKNGQLMMHEQTDTIKEEKGQSIDQLFREVFKC